MNIFCTDRDPIQSAINLDDKRAKHMGKECVELLGIYIHSVTDKWVIPFPLWDAEIRNEPNFLYNHPVSKWVRKDRANMTWLFKHLIAICDENVYRFDKVNSCEQYIPVLREILSPLFVEEQPRVFQNSSLFKNLPPIEAYRETMKKKWFETDKVRPVQWTRRKPPEWALTQSKLEL